MKQHLYLQRWIIRAYNYKTKINDNSHTEADSMQLATLCDTARGRVEVQRFFGAGRRSGSGKNVPSSFLRVNVLASSDSDQRPLAPRQGVRGILAIYHRVNHQWTVNTGDAVF